MDELRIKIMAALGHCFIAIGEQGLDTPGAKDLMDAIRILEGAWQRVDQLIVLQAREKSSKEAGNE